MRILVTGGAGFIGSHLVEKLLAAGHEVSILDDFNDFYDPQIKRANIAAVAGDVSIHRVDLRDSAGVNLLFHREKFDAIVHLAARAGVRPSISQPQLYYDTNVSGTLHLLEAARHVGIERFVFASSSSVYGICHEVPFSEDFNLTQTISPYAATKVAGEFLCSTYSHLYQMRIVALRFFTVYGARQRPDLAIHQFTRKIDAGQPIDQFGDGTTRRDYTYIDDIIQGVTAALEYHGPLYDLFNLGESETIQLKELIAAIENALGKKAKINQLPEQPGDVPLTCADISKARKLLGYNPTTKLSEGLPKFVDWFRTCSRGRWSRPTLGEISYGRDHRSRLQRKRASSPPPGLDRVPDLLRNYVHVAKTPNPGGATGGRDSGGRMAQRASPAWLGRRPLCCHARPCPFFRGT
jgi:UDP-glucuronate 4-epimerase